MSDDSPTNIPPQSATRAVETNRIRFAKAPQTSGNAKDATAQAVDLAHTNSRLASWRYLSSGSVLQGLSALAGWALYGARRVSEKRHNRFAGHGLAGHSASKNGTSQSVRRRATYAALLAGLLLAPTVRAQPTPPKPFADRVGVNVKFAQGQPPEDIGLLSELGVKWVRDSVLWAEVEPSAGNFVPFPDAFRKRLAFYKSQGIGVCFPVLYDNPAAYPNSKDNPRNAWNSEAYGRFAAEAARQMKASGVRFVLELYNEPHNTLKDLGGPFNGEPPSPWLDHYVAMVAEATKAIKAVDPSIKVLTDDDMWVLQYRFLEKGLPAAVDGLAVHPYVRAWPEFSATEPDTSWTQPFVTVDTDRSFHSAVRRLRDYGTAKLGHTPSVWVTEWGWPLGEPLADGRVMNEDLLAGLIPRAYVTAADAGVETLLWFSLQDSVDGPMGLTTNDRVRRVPFRAMKTMIETIGKTTTVEHVVGSDHRTSGIQAYRLAGGGVDPVVVVWHVGGDETVEVTGVDLTAVARVRQSDVVGRSAGNLAFEGGRLKLAIGRSPLYLTGLPAGASFKAIPPVGRPAVYLFP